MAEWNIIGRVSNQSLSVCGKQIAGDSMNYLTACFRFVTPDWEGLSRVLAHFSMGESLYEIELDENGEITADKHMNLTAGTWRIWLHGELRDGETLLRRITTNVCELTVEETGGSGGDPFGPYPETELDRITDALAGKADAVQDTENAGKFWAVGADGGLVFTGGTQDIENKQDKMIGAQYAGDFLVVGEDGTITHAAMQTWQGGTF